MKILESLVNRRVQGFFYFVPELVFYSFWCEKRSRTIQNDRKWFTIGLLIGLHRKSQTACRKRHPELVSLHSLLQG